MPDRSIERRVVLVTGAAQGIGAAIAIALAKDGFDVAVSSRNPANLAETAERIQAAGSRAHALGLDLRSVTRISEAVDEVVRALGRVDVLVNNAGVPSRGAAVDVTPEEWNEIIGTNLTGTFFVSQKVGKHLIESGRPGSIINLASTHGVVGLAGRSVYGISKGAIIQMTRMLAIEWAQHGIRVNAIAPGTVETPSRAAFFAANKSVRSQLIERIPLRRFATADEVAGSVRYLAGPEGAYVTGQTLLLDGGLTAY